MDQTSVDDVVYHQICQQRTCLFHKSAWDGWGSGAEPLLQARGLSRESRELWKRSMIQLPCQVTDHFAGFIDRDLSQVAAVVQPFQEHRPAAGVGCQQPYGSVTTPTLQGQMLMLGLGVRPGDLEDCGGAVSTPDRQHQRRHTVHRVSVEGEIPLGQRLIHEPRQPCQPVVTADIRLRLAAGHQS